MARPLLHRAQQAAAAALGLTASLLSAGAGIAGAAAEALRPRGDNRGIDRGRDRAPDRAPETNATALTEDGLTDASAAPVAAERDRAAHKVAENYAARGRVEPRTRETVPVTDDVSMVSPTHAVELAERSASEVIAAVPSLSTDELALLLEHETATRQRKTVLAAIERSLVAGIDPPTERTR